MKITGKSTNSANSTSGTISSFQNFRFQRFNFTQIPPFPAITLERMNFAPTDTHPQKSASRSRAELSNHPSSCGFHPLSAPLSHQTPSLPDDAPLSDRPRCGGRESKFLADAEKPPGDLYDALTVRVKPALGGRTPYTVAFTWMQGERDAKSGLSASYEEALKGLIKAVRDDLKHPDAVVVIGRLSDHQKGKEHWNAVRAIQEKVATQDPRGAWVDSDDLNGEKNDLHCTKEGFAELVWRFASKAVELLGKPSVSPVKP